jgi:hypothetical protein
MNIEITKSKNTPSSDTLNNRLLRLEKILQQLQQLSGNTAKNNNTDSIGRINNNNDLQRKLFADLVLSSAKDSTINQESLTNIKSTANTQKLANNRLVLSRGQIIAELALAIARAGRRNS